VCCVILQPTGKIFKTYYMTTTKHLLRKVSVYIFLVCIFNSSLFGQNNAAKKSNKEIAISYITEVVNNRKLNLIPEIYSSEYVIHGMDGIEKHAIQDSSLISFLNYLFKAFPDLNYSIDNAVAEADIVALNLTGKGTHKDEFFGFPASNKKIVYKEMFFFRLLNGKIIEGWVVVDIEGVKNQISKK